MMWGCAGSRIRPKVQGTGRRASKQYLLFVFLGAFIVCAPLALSKQKPPPTRTIYGQVLDVSSRGISGASVLLTDLETHKTNAIYAGADGRYIFSGLNAYDDYKIRARYHGVTSTTRQVSSMDPRIQIVVNLTVSPRSQK
jgi:hypothetical protein